jgi:hypothetical protein
VVADEYGGSRDPMLISYAFNIHIGHEGST